MAAFGFLIALANVVVAGLCLLWWGADRTGSGMPILVGFLAFNMAMGWLLVAGMRPAKERPVWSGRPASFVVGAAVMLVAAWILQSALNNNAKSTATDLVQWKCPDGTTVWGVSSPCPGGERPR